MRAKGSGLGLFIVRSVAQEARRPRVRRERAAPGQRQHVHLLLPKAPRRD